MGKIEPTRTIVSLKNTWSFVSFVCSYFNMLAVGLWLVYTIFGCLKFIALSISWNRKDELPLSTSSLNNNCYNLHTFFWAKNYTSVVVRIWRSSRLWYVSGHIEAPLLCQQAHLSYKPDMGPRIKPRASPRAHIWSDITQPKIQTLRDANKYN